MKKIVRYAFAAIGLIILAQFSSQDGNVSGGGKPKVNFYGKVTDSSDKTFDAENIVFEGLYKQIPVYQIPPQKAPTSYDPSDNVTRLDLSEIEKITVDPEQILQTIKNRKYIVIKVYSKVPVSEEPEGKKQKRSSHQGNNPLINDYLVEADKKINCDEGNPAGPIEKEIRIKAIKEIIIEGYEQAKEEEKGNDSTKNKKQKTAQTDQPSRRRQLIAYVQKWFHLSKRAA